MASGSGTTKGLESHEVQLVSNEVKQPKFKPIPEVAYKNDPAGPLSVIPDKVVMVQDVHRCYNCKIGAIGDLEIHNAFTKKIVHRVTSIPTLDQPKTLRSEKREVIEKNTGAKWNNRGMTIDTVTNPLLDFAVRIISHKFYQSRG